jgi:hypothetical protein
MPVTGRSCAHASIVADFGVHLGGILIEGTVTHMIHGLLSNCFLPLLSVIRIPDVLRKVPLEPHKGSHLCSWSCRYILSHMRGIITSLPQYVFMAWCLVKHRDNFMFYLYFSHWVATESYDISFGGMILRSLYNPHLNYQRQDNIKELHPINFL